MVQIVNLLYFGLVLGFCFQNGYSLKCFVCNSHDDERCKETIVPKQLEQDCSELKDRKNYSLCRKIKQTIDVDVNQLRAEERIIRSCGWVNSTEECYHRTGFGIRQTVCTCTKDSCNGSSAIFFSASLLAATFSALKLLM